MRNFELFEIYEAAINTADLQLQEAEAIPIVSLILGALSVKPMALAAKVIQLQRGLFELDRLVTQAMFLKLEAQIQQALGLVTGTVSLLAPGMSLLAKGGLTIVDLMLDDKLGPDKSAIKNDLGNITKILSLSTDAIGDVKRFGSATHKIASKTGKVLTVTGFYFDWDEVNQADQLLRDVEREMKKAKKLYDDLVQDLAPELARLGKLEREFKTRLAPLHREVWDKRAIRDELIKDSGYTTVTRFRWQFQAAPQPTQTN